MKKFLIGLAIVTGILAGAALFVTRNTGVSNPALKATDLPALIPTRTFFADPRSASGYVPSSDGAYVFLNAANLLGRKSVVREVSTGDEVAIFPVGLSHIRWHPTQPRLRFIYNGHDWEADIFAPEQENWKRTSPVRLSGGWIKNQVAWDEDMPILAWGKENRNSPGHLWLVSQDGLTAEKIAEGNEKTQYWVMNEEVEPVLRIDNLDERTNRVLKKTADGWDTLIDIDLNDAFWPLSAVRADGTFIARSAIGRDKAAIVNFDADTGAEEVIYASEDTDVGWGFSLTHGPDPDVIRLGTDTLERKALTERGQTYLDILATFDQPVTLGATVPSATGRYVAQALSTQSKSYIYLLIDMEEKSYELLGEFHMRRFKDRLVQEEFVTFPARDGLDIPAVLTMPKDPAGPIPFVVDIHGGPAGHEGLGYHHFNQFLVNRGYGVLSVNFRGSTGFGKAFQAKGFRQFGRAMQDDIADAALWLIDQGLADPDAIAARGASYGGYAAAMAMMRDPGLFTAGIVEVPMLDVAFQSKYHPGFWNNGIHGWWRYFGNPDVPEDLEEMQAFSPINLVDQLHGPLLVMGGVQDEITAIQQVRDFEAATDAAGKDVRVHYFPKAGHGFRHWKDELAHARLVEDFLAEQIGGRSGGTEFVEFAPEFID